MSALQLPEGGRAYTLREFCLKHIALDLKYGRISRDAAQTFTVLLAYFCNHQYASMHDILGLQILAQNWDHAPDYDPSWRRAWPCCATCARNIGNTGQSAFIPELIGQQTCAACGNATDGMFFVLRSPDMARTAPVKTHSTYGTN